MLEAIVNSKNIHRAIRATADPYESALDSGMDFVEPETPEYLGYNLCLSVGLVNASTDRGIDEYKGQNRGCFEASAVPKLSGLARTVKKLGIAEVIGVLDSKHINGYYRCRLLCLDGSILEDDVSMDELKALPELRKGSAFDEWIGGSYPTDPIMEEAFYKIENKDKLSSCVLCGRTLTHPVSVKRHIGPECFKRVTPFGNTFVVGDEVAQGLVDASAKYSEERFRKWIIRAVLTLEAPLPEKTLDWLGHEYWGYSNKPSLYYLSVCPLYSSMPLSVEALTRPTDKTDASNKLNCIEVKKKHLAHRQITSLSTCENDLDYRAWGMVHGKEEIVYIEIDQEDLVYIKRQWLFFEGNDRPSVYLENTGHLWCNCHRPNCKHIQKIKGLVGGDKS